MRAPAALALVAVHGLACAPAFPAPRELASSSGAPTAASASTRPHVTAEAPDAGAYEDPTGAYRVRFSGEPKVKTVEVEADEGDIVRTEAKHHTKHGLELVTASVISKVGRGYCAATLEETGARVLAKLHCRVSQTTPRQLSGVEGRVHDFTCDTGLRGFLAIYCDGSRIESRREAIEYAVNAVYVDPFEEKAARAFLESFEILARP